MEPPEPSADRQRFVALEERLSYQQQLIDELNGVVLEQGRRLDHLSRELAAQRAALERLAELGRGEDLPHEKPPHY
jgi:SlyX protein